MADQLIVGGRPGLRQGEFPSRDAERCQPLRGSQRLPHASHQSLVIPRRETVAIFVLANHFRDAAHARRHGRRTRRHRLGDHQPESFLRRGEDEDIRAGVSLAERLAAEGAGEMRPRPGEDPLQTGAGRAIADQRQARAGEPLQDRADALQLLLCREAPDVE